MKVERLVVEGFGRLKELDTGPEPLPGLVTVLGPNEAGKSTLFHFLTSLIYGFYPASRDAHPYTPWDGGDPAGGMTLRLDGGGCVEVERRLRSQPTGRMTVGDTVEDLRNRTLPWAEHIPRAVFLQVFALTLEELAGLEEETWGRIQDRIVGSMGAADVLPARQIVAELEQAAGELWRPTRRGNQRIRDIQNAILELRDRRRSSGERDRALREMVRELDRLRDELQVARQERNVARLAVERVQALVPVRNQLRRIAALREDAGSTETLEGIPADPQAELVARRRRVEEFDTRQAELRRERAEPEAAVAALDESARRILQRGAEVSSRVARAAGVRGERARLAGLEQEIRDLHRRLEAQAAAVLSQAWTADVEAALSALPMAEVRERVRRTRAAAEEVRILEASSHREPATSAQAAPPAALAGSLAVLLPGLILLAWGVMGGGGGLAIGAGSAAAAVGLAFLALWLRARKPAVATVSTGALDARRAQASQALVAARSATAELLTALPIAPALLEDPDEVLVVGLERLQEILRDRTDRLDAARTLQEAMATVEAEVRALAAELDLEDARDADAAAHLLERALRRAEGLNQAATAAEREVRRLDREEERLQQDGEVARAELAALEQTLTDAGAGDLDRGARMLRDRIQARDRANQLQDELERAHPDLDELRSRIQEAEEQGDSWTMDDEDLARRKARVEELTEHVEALATRAEALDRDIVHLQEGETVDAVDGEIASLQHEEAILLGERDRLWVLAQVLKEADRRFREEHQPDLLRRAGVHLAALTDGRYDRIVVDESAGGERFHLTGPALPNTVPLAHPISTGTLEQAYLALRLAIVDHLDHGLEKLPLFVDEVLVNWDERRRRRGIELLGSLSQDRQIFVFTCHPMIADELANAGARVLDLGARGTR